MANPLPNEAQIYEKIKQEKIKIHPLVWELISHYIGNDVHVIHLITGSHVFGDNPSPIPAEDGKKILHRCDEVSRFLKKLREATKKDG